MAVLICAMAAAFFLVRFVMKLSRDDSTFWERGIRSFEKQDLETPPSTGTIVFTGSSSIRHWKPSRKTWLPFQC
jgi:hypothetical protein